MKNGIIVPCFNNESNLNLMKIEKFALRHPKTIFCFVNNASNDKTLLTLKTFQKKLLNSHNSLATQILILDLPSKLSLLDLVKSGQKHLLVNTLVERITIEEKGFKLNFKSFLTTKKEAINNAA